MCRQQLQNTKKTIAARRNKICLTRRGILPVPVSPNFPVVLRLLVFFSMNALRVPPDSYSLHSIMHFTLSSVCFFRPSTNTYTFINISYHSYLLQPVDILIPLESDQRQQSVIGFFNQSFDVSFRSEIDQRSPLFMHRRH